MIFKVGITAWGDQECNGNRADVFADVSKALGFIDWATKCLDGPNTNYFGLFITCLAFLCAFFESSFMRKRFFTECSASVFSNNGATFNTPSFDKLRTSRPWRNSVWSLRIALNHTSGFSSARARRNGSSFT